MSRKVPSGRRADVTYLLGSPYFVCNFASLLIYPACRFSGMQNQALSVFSESVSASPRLLSCRLHGISLLLSLHD